MAFAMKEGGLECLWRFSIFLLKNHLESLPDCRNAFWALYYVYIIYIQRSRDVIWRFVFLLMLATNIVHFKVSVNNRCQENGEKLTLCVVAQSNMLNSSQSDSSAQQDSVHQSFGPSISTWWRSVWSDQKNVLSERLQDDQTLGVWAVWPSISCQQEGQVLRSEEVQHS